MVASVLRDRIVNGELGDGDLLPKQDELLEEFRISRPSLREALRILESEGLLTVRRGNVGGSVVEAPNAESSAYMFGLVLQSRRGSVAVRGDAMRQSDPITASLCAERPDREKSVAPQLQANIDVCEGVLGDGPRFTVLSRRFHEELVAACGNETLILMVGALESLWSEQERQWAQRAQSKGHYPIEKYQRDVIAAHKVLLAAIVAGQSEKAARIARKHLQESQHYALEEGSAAVVRATSLRNGFTRVGA
jgi:GntR family transcriptional repressor for pyruvate dehydrogenase complex